MHDVFRDRHELPPQGPQLSLAVIGDRNVTSVALTLRLLWRRGAGKSLRSARRAVNVTGSAKREKGDPYEAEIGVAFALARALRNMAAELEHDAWARVRYLENRAAAERVRQVKKQQRAGTVKRLLTTSEIHSLYGPEAAALHEQRQRNKVQGGTG